MTKPPHYPHEQKRWEYQPEHENYNSSDKHCCKTHKANEDGHKSNTGSEDSHNCINNKSIGKTTHGRDCIRIINNSLPRRKKCGKKDRNRKEMKYENKKIFPYTTYIRESLSIMPHYVIRHNDEKIHIPSIQHYISFCMACMRLVE